MEEYCNYCGNEVRVQIFKGTGLCSNKCRKYLKRLKEEAVLNQNSQHPMKREN